MERKEYKTVEVKKTSLVTYFCDGCNKRIGTQSFEVKGCAYNRVTKPVQFYTVYRSDSEETLHYCINCINSIFINFVYRVNDFGNCFGLDVEYKEINDVGSDTDF